MLITLAVTISPMLSSYSYRREHAVGTDYILVGDSVIEHKRDVSKERPTHNQNRKRTVFFIIMQMAERM